MSLPAVRRGRIVDLKKNQQVPQRKSGTGSTTFNASGMAGVVPNRSDGALGPLVYPALGVDDARTFQEQLFMPQNNRPRGRSISAM